MIKKISLITISISEGKQYQFGKITLYGLDDFDSKIFEEILNFNLMPGSIFSRAGIELTQDNIKYILGEKGYAFPEIIFNVDFNDESSLVDIDFRVNVKSNHMFVESILLVILKLMMRYIDESSDNLNHLCMVKIKWKDQKYACSV